MANGGYGASRRLPGSNQHQERTTAGPSADVADRVRMAEGMSVRASSHADVTGEALSNRPIATLVADLSVAKEDGLKGHGLVFNEDGLIVGRGGPQATEQQILDNTGVQASHMDAILQRHPDYYGQATLDALDWEMLLAADPNKRRELEDPESDTSRLTNDYVQLLSDQSASAEQRMGVDDMAELLLDIQTTRKRIPQCSDDSGDYASEEARRSRLRHTALSLACSRSSSPEERARHLVERDALEAQLNLEYTEELGLNKAPHLS